MHITSLDIFVLISLLAITLYYIFLQYLNFFICSSLVVLEYGQV